MFRADFCCLLVPEYVSRGGFRGFFLCAYFFVRYILHVAGLVNYEYIYRQWWKRKTSVICDCSFSFDWINDWMPERWNILQLSYFATNNLHVSLLWKFYASTCYFFHCRFFWLLWHRDVWNYFNFVLDDILILS